MGKFYYTNIFFLVLAGVFLNQHAIACRAAVVDQVEQRAYRCPMRPASLNGWREPSPSSPGFSFEQHKAQVSRDLQSYLVQLGVNSANMNRIAGSCLNLEEPSKTNMNLAILRVITSLPGDCKPKGSIKSIKVTKTESYRTFSRGGATKRTDVIAAGSTCLIDLKEFDGTGRGDVEIELINPAGKITIPYDSRTGIARPHETAAVWESQIGSSFTQQFCKAEPETTVNSWSRDMTITYPDGRVEKVKPKVSTGF